METYFTYSKFSQELKILAIKNLKVDFEKLCEFAIIYKPNYLANTLSDEDIEPYISSKYINLICEYLKKKITLRLLFEYFRLENINFRDQEYDEEFDPSKYMICAMGKKINKPYDIIYPITWDEDAYTKESTDNQYKLKEFETRCKILSYKKVLDVEVKLDSFALLSDLIPNETLDDNFDFVEQITYKLYDIIIMNLELYKNNNNLTDSPINKETFQNEITVGEEPKIISENEIILQDKNIRPTIIIIDEPKSNAKIEKNIQLSDNSLQIIYNYNSNEVKSEKESDILKNLTKLLNSILDKLE